MDKLQAAYLVCAAVHLAFWLYGHLKGQLTGKGHHGKIQKIWE